jgi:toxin YoeB
MRLVWTPNFRRQYGYWASVNRHFCARIDRLILDIFAHPFSGIGKVEKLKNLKNEYSRRISAEHRLIYRVNWKESIIDLLSCYGHYEIR